MNIHHYIHYDQHDEHTIIKKLNQIIMEQKDFALQLTALKDQAEKAKAEILAKVQSLEDALDAADDVAPEVQAAFDELKASIQGIDDLNADSTPTV